MAEIKCLNHKPEHPHQHSYAFPVGYPITPHRCKTQDCTTPPLIWLNPEEVKEHERGERRFQEVESWETLRADNRGVEHHHDVFVIKTLASWGRSLWHSLAHLPRCLAEARRQRSGVS